MKERVRPLLVFLVIGVISIAGFLNIFLAFRAAGEEISSISAEMSSSTVSIPPKGEKPHKIVAKGVYLTAYSAGSSKKMDQIIDLIDRTELNAVVMDLKDYSGLVLYDSKVPLVNQLRLKDNRYPSITSTIKKLHDHKIYVIGRITVFQDPVLAAKKPEWSIKNKSGGLWRDYKGLAWVDPTKKEVWDYDVAIAKEAATLGFDELNFDYVRFPSDGNMKTMAYPSGLKKYETMAKFYEYLGGKLKNDPVWVSLDLFGFVMEKKGTDDMNIGQRLADAVQAADYVCPMMYPSHYPSGHLGLSNPAAYPTTVIDNGMKKGVPVFEGQKAELRPWIQAFDMGAVYSDGVKIRQQIDAVEKYKNAGWLLWNAANRYTSAGLKP